MSDDIIIIIPAYNEGTIIYDTIRSLTESGYNNIVVIDDGSSDNTVNVARNAGVVVIEHPFNMGQGAALQTGFEYALKRNAEIVITFDADGQHGAGDIQNLIHMLYVNDCEVALGSRFMGDAPNISNARRILLFWGRIFTKLTGGPWLSDVHNGLRAIRTTCLNNLKITHSRMAHASELLYKIKKKNIKYCEVPVSIVYNSYSTGKGQHGLLGALNIVWDIIFSGRS